MHCCYLPSRRWHLLLWPGGNLAELWPSPQDGGIHTSLCPERLVWVLSVLELLHSAVERPGVSHHAQDHYHYGSLQVAVTVKLIMTSTCQVPHREISPIYVCFFVSQWQLDGEQPHLLDAQGLDFYILSTKTQLAHVHNLFPPTPRHTHSHTHAHTHATHNHTHTHTCV